MEAFAAPATLSRRCRTGGGVLCGGCQRLHATRSVRSGSPAERLRGARRRPFRAPTLMSLFSPEPKQPKRAKGGNDGEKGGGDAERSAGGYIRGGVPGLSALLRAASDVFRKFDARDDETRSSVVHMAAAISDDTVSAASAFAAASTIASHTRSFTTSDSLTPEQEAQLRLKLEQAQQVKNAEQLRRLVDRGELVHVVEAARVLDGRGRASALTALATFAVLRPELRHTILQADFGSISNSITRILLRGTANWSGGRYLSGWESEGVVSGSHLLGSLALSRDAADQEWRRRIARDDNVRRVLHRLSEGENDVAARAARRALATLGVNEWKPRVAGQRGLRILSIDGGGTRALLAFETLKYIKSLVGAEIHEMFDVICGTSTGAIIAVSVGLREKTVEQVEQLYRELIGKVFTKGPMSTPKMVLTRAFYDSQTLEALLKRECGRGVFIDSAAEKGIAKVFAVSSQLAANEVKCHVFRNYTYPVGHEGRFSGTADAQIWEGLRASSAAPTFFTEMRINGVLHADGAIVANNPTAVAIHEAQCIYPGIPIEVVVSMGNGLTQPSITDLLDVETRKDKLGWYDILDSYIFCAVQTEDVHHVMEELVSTDSYFRFNPTTNFDGIDEVRPEKLVEMIDDAVQYIRHNEERFRRLAEILRPRGLRSYWSQLCFSTVAEWHYVQRLYQRHFNKAHAQHGTAE